MKEKFEDTKEVIIIHKLKDRQHNGKKGTQGQTTIYKTLYRKIEQYESLLKPRVNSSTTEG